MTAGNWIAAFEAVVTALLIVRMVVAGFFQPAGQLLSWPMFTRGCYITFDFEVGSATGTHQLSLLDLVMSDAASVKLPQLQWMTDYLAQRYDRVSGYGRMSYAGGTVALRIEHGRVVRIEGDGVAG